MTSVVWAAKKLEKCGEEKQMSAWAAEKRSPSAGRRKRAVTDVAKASQGKYPQLDVNSSGIV